MTRIAIYLTEALATLSALTFATTLPPAWTFGAGMAWVLFLLWLGRWEAVGA